MEITFNYGGVMPEQIQQQLEKYSGWELIPDFDEDEEDEEEYTTTHGVYFMGDIKSEQEMRKDFKSEGRRWNKKYSEGYLTKEAAADIVAFFDSIVSEENLGCWQVDNWTYDSIVQMKEYKATIKKHEHPDAKTKFRFVDFEGCRYWYEYRLANKGEICLATEDPEKYCNGVYAYSPKDPGNGKAFVVLLSNNHK